MNRTNESLPRTPTLAAGPDGVHVKVVPVHRGPGEAPGESEHLDQAAL